MNQSLPEQQICRQWLEQMVIGHNFCPFAQREFLRNSIRYVVCHSSKSKVVLDKLLDECRYLDEQPATETTLLIMPVGFADFYRYLQWLDAAQQCLLDAGYEGIYQLASFHPDYCFTDCEYDDAANFTNRSPYPIVHLLREERLASAIAAYPAVEDIPQRNMDYARRLGHSVLQQQLESLLRDR